jgi:hypothetical protein
MFERRQASLPGEASKCMATKAKSARRYDRTQVPWIVEIGGGDNAGLVRVIPVEGMIDGHQRDERGALLEALQVIENMQRRLTASKNELHGHWKTLPKAAV